MSQQPGIGPQRIRSSATVNANGLGIITFDFTGYLTGRRGAVTRMIAGLVLPVGELANLAIDTFTRTVAAGSWGTPDLGPAWIILSGTAANYDVDSGVGKYVREILSAAINLPLNVQDCTIVATHNLASGAGRDNRNIARAVDTNNYVIAEIRGAGSPFTIRLTKRVAGVETVITSTTKTLTYPVNCRFTLDGQTISGKWWNCTDVEPTAYDLATGLGPTPASGGVGVGWTSDIVSGTQEVDNLTVSTSTPTAPHWDAYIGDVSNPSNLVDSSQGIALPRWVPALVNGQPVSQGDVLSIVAIGGTPGAKLVASCYLVTEPA